jgi:hypothetical protein
MVEYECNIFNYRTASWLSMNATYLIRTASWLSSIATSLSVTAAELLGQPP